MPIGGILIAIFVGYILDKEVSKKQLFHIQEKISTKFGYLQSNM